MPIKINTKNTKIILSDYLGFSSKNEDEYFDVTTPLEDSYDLLFFKLSCYIETSAKKIIRKIIGSDINIKGENMYSVLNNLVEYKELSKVINIAIYFHKKRNLLAHNFSYLPSMDKEFKKYINEVSVKIDPIETIKDVDINKLVRTAESVIHCFKLIEYSIYQGDITTYVCPEKDWKEYNMSDICLDNF